MVNQERIEELQQEYSRVENIYECCGVEEVEASCAARMTELEDELISLGVII